MSRLFKLFLGLLFCLSFFSMTCKKKSTMTETIPNSTEGTIDSTLTSGSYTLEELQAKTDSSIAKYGLPGPTDAIHPPTPGMPTYRDVPAPPAEWNMTLPDGADTCAHIMFQQLKTMYPIIEDNYWDYNIYGITGEPADRLEARVFRKNRLDFYNDTITQLYGWNPHYEKIFDCVPPDSTFFLQTLGEPTCKTFNYGTQYTTFRYFIRLKWRNRPCAYVPDTDTENEQRCSPGHFEYCRMLLLRFSHKTGNMVGLNAF